jgi:hypothetical protein
MALEVIEAQRQNRFEGSNWVFTVPARDHWAGRLLQGQDGRPDARRAGAGGGGLDDA